MRHPTPLARSRPDGAEPYHGWLENDCMHRHGTSRGLAHVLIEVRNDLLTTADGVQAWCDRIGGEGSDCR